LKRVIILVLDALGIGAMQDVPRTRPRDAGANTLLHLLEWAERDLDKPLSLPNLARLSLGKVLEHSILTKDADGSGTVVGSAALGYPGADSYIAHQTMMGSDMTAIGLEPFSELEQLVAEALVAAGHEVRRALPDLPVLLVDGCMVVGDNLEADPGLNYNVTGSLELTSFGEVKERSTA
jgi:phosphopentomutase